MDLHRSLNRDGSAFVQSDFCCECTFRPIVYQLRERELLSVDPHLNNLSVSGSLRLLANLQCFLTADINPQDSTSSLLVSRKELVKSDFLSVLYIDAPDVCWPLDFRSVDTFKKQQKTHLFTPAFEQCSFSLFYIWSLYCVSFWSFFVLLHPDCSNSIEMNRFSLLWGRSITVTTAAVL